MAASLPAPTATVAGTGRASAGRPSTTLALARVEGRRLLAHPALLAGLVLTLWLGAPWLQQRAAMDVPNAVYSALSGLLIVPLAAGVFVAANLGALRARRDRTQELFDSLPVAASTRTASHLAAVGWAVALSVTVLGGAAASVRAWDGAPVALAGGLARVVPDAAQLAQGPAVLALLGVYGILLARWFPYRAATVPSLVGLFAMFVVVSWNLGGTAGWWFPVASPLEETGTWSEAGTGGGGYSVVHRVALAAARWHLLYLVGLTGLAAAGALARHGATRRLAGAASLFLIVAVSGGVAQLQ